MLDAVRARFKDEKVGGGLSLVCLYCIVCLPLGRMCVLSTTMDLDHSNSHGTSGVTWCYCYGVTVTLSFSVG